jgi:hypothetical protein
VAPDLQKQRGIIKNTLFIELYRLPQRAISERIIHRDSFTFSEGRKTKGVRSGFAVEPFGLLAESEKGV